MADAVSPKEAELRREANDVLRRLDAEMLSGALPVDLLPRGVGIVQDALQAAFEAGERKERERCAKVAEAGAVVHVGCVQSGYGGGGYSCHLAIARVIRGGESTNG